MPDPPRLSRQQSRLRDSLTGDSNLAVSQTTTLRIDYFRLVNIATGLSLRFVHTSTARSLIRMGYLVRVSTDEDEENGQPTLYRWYDPNAPLPGQTTFAYVPESEDTTGSGSPESGDTPAPNTHSHPPPADLT